MKRNLIVIFWILNFLYYFLVQKPISCYLYLSKIDSLNTKFSKFCAKKLVRLLSLQRYQFNYILNDPYFNLIKKAISNASFLNFLHTNIIFLKRYEIGSKGIILIKYSNILNYFPFIFDLFSLAEKYNFVLEPSTEGPFQPYVFLFKFINKQTKVFIQALSKRESVFFKKMGYEIVDLCAGDWVDDRIFKFSNKLPVKYNVCIISNFIDVKRYRFLLKSLSKIENIQGVIIASKWVGNSEEWIDKLLNEYSLKPNFDIFIEINQTKVNEILNQSDFYLLGSIREGANKAAFESMLAGVPALIYNHHLGFPTFRFGSPLVYYYSNSEDIREIILTTKIDKREISNTASKMTGQSVANDTLRKLFISKGLITSKDFLAHKVNIVQCKYLNSEDAPKFKEDFNSLELSDRRQLFKGDMAVKSLTS